ncbi:MAG: hypothetical protein ACFBSE_20120 [Prochloraceae cyanobacterium]
MTSTEALAAEFNITPSTLKKWLKGNKPSRGKYVKVCQSIFDQFEYVDEEWFPKTKPNNTETISPVSEKEPSETAEPTIEQIATSTENNSKEVENEDLHKPFVSRDNQIVILDPIIKNQYRCIGVVKGRYIPGNEDIREGILLTDSGVFRASILKSNWSPPVDEKIWITWVRTNKEEPHLYFCLKGIYPKDPSELDKDIFNVRGNLVLWKPDRKRLVIGVRPNKKAIKEFKQFYIDIEGTLTEPRLDSFWDVTATREGNHLVMVEGKEIFPPLLKKKKKVKQKNRKKHRSEIICH